MEFSNFKRKTPQKRGPKPKPKVKKKKKKK